MAIRGQKILIDLSDSEDEAQQPSEASQPIMPLTSFIGDVLERKTTSATPPKPPAPRTNAAGFPAHRKRLDQSRFKASRSASSDASKAPTVSLSQSPAAAAMSQSSSSQNNEQHQIDMENKQRLDQMTDAEIQQERDELLENINPALLQALLRRSKLEPGDDNADFPGLSKESETSFAVEDRPKKSAKKVTFDETVTTRSETAADLPAALEDTESTPSAVQERGSNHVHEDESLAGSIHFPRPDQPPSLDPNSPSFLEDLHRKYFPSLPADPEKLEWMRPSTEASSYSPTQAAVDPKDIRFGFDGALIPPSTAAEIPVTAGLHHHGDAPEAAGYTIAELARLARSKVAAQRCIAFQTLGRILYRLGKGEYGDPSEGQPGVVGAEDTLDELARGLWAEVEQEKVINICTSESEGKGMTGQRHVSAQAYATEAIWLWQKGGGRRWKTN